MIKRITPLLLTIIFTIPAVATDLPSVFKKSYEYEYAGNYKNAIAVLKDIYDKESYEINLRLGWLYFNSSLFQQASEYYDKCIASKPLSIEAKFGKIKVLTAMGYWDKAIKQYNEIFRVDPSNSKAHYKLGLIYYNRKDFRNALKHFEKVVNLYPFDHDGLLMSAWTNLQLQKFKEAKVLFEKVLMNTPGDESALEGLTYIK